MTSDIDVITLEDVHYAVQDILVTHGDALNPVDEYGLCLYTDKTDPSRHCLGGAVLLSLDCELPLERENVCTTPSRERFKNFQSMTLPGDAMLFLRLLQEAADSGNFVSETNDRRLPWQDAYEKTLDDWPRRMP